MYLGIFFKNIFWNLKMSIKNVYFFLFLNIFFKTVCVFCHLDFGFVFMYLLGEQSLQEARSEIKPIWQLSKSCWQNNERKVGINQTLYTANSLEHKIQNTYFFF